ncbi:MAG: hypothetical protein ABJB40_12385 [Acidobacteriota bacterium]
MEKNEVVVANLQNKKEVTVMIGPTSILKKYPTEMAERLAGFQMAGGGARPAGQNGAQSPIAPGGQAQTAGAGRAGFAGGRGAGGGGLDEMFDRFPNITAADLKAGDLIAFSSSKNADITRVKAIKLVAGVEPFLRAAQSAGGRRGQSNGAGPDFNIPGLDSVSFP